MSNSHLSSGHLRRLRTSGEGSQQLWRHCAVMSLISASPSPPESPTICVGQCWLPTPDRVTKRTRCWNVRSCGGQTTRLLSKALSVLALALTQEVQLCLVQSLRDVRDQIGRVFDADRQPDRGVENAYFLPDVSRNAGMGHACGQAGKRLGPAQAHRQLEDLQRVQEFESGGLAADNVERERGACAGALPREHTAGR